MCDLRVPDASTLVRHLCGAFVRYFLPMPSGGCTAFGKRSAHPEGASTEKGLYQEAIRLALPRRDRR